MRDSLDASVPVLKPWACSVCCNTTYSDAIAAKEMMFAFEDEFPYRECSECRTQQID